MIKIKTFNLDPSNSQNSKYTFEGWQEENTNIEILSTQVETLIIPTTKQALSRASTKVSDSVLVSSFTESKLLHVSYKDLS